MKALFATAIILLSAVSIWAQGQIVVTGSVSGEVMIAPSVAVEAPDVEINAGAVNLREVNFGIPVNLSSATMVIGEINFPTASGAEMVAASRPMPGIFQSPILPPSPDFPVRLSAGVIQIQAVPEPSTLALGSLSLGLIALARLKKRHPAKSN